MFNHPLLSEMSMTCTDRNGSIKPSGFGPPHFSYKDCLENNCIAQNINNNSLQKQDNCGGTMMSSKPYETSMTFSASSHGLRRTDVAIGRVKLLKNHIGNKNLSNLVASTAVEYDSADKKVKSVIISAIVEWIRSNGRFVTFNPQAGRWTDVDPSKARDMVAQQFRNVLHSNYKSSLRSKKKMRENKNKILAYKNSPNAFTEQTSTSGGKVFDKKNLQPTKQSDVSRGHVRDHHSLEPTSSIPGSFNRIDNDFDAEIKYINFDGIPNSADLHEYDISTYANFSS